MRCFDTLRCLNDGAPDIVKPQFHSNQAFVPGLIKYLKTTDTSLLEGSSFELLTAVFNVKNHKGEVDEALVVRLFDSLGFLKR